MNRRFFIKSGSIALASVGAQLSTPSFLERLVLAGGSQRTSLRRKMLVTIFQRGAVDGLNMVIPYGESNYYQLRPSIAIARPGSGDVETAIDLDGFFGLHPSMRSFKTFWESKRLAIIHAAGSPDSTRSHFDAQDYMESGTPGIKSTAAGFLNRHLQISKGARDSVFRAVALSKAMPRILQGPAPAVAISNLADFTIRAGNSSAVQGGFEAIYERSVNDVLAGTGKETFEAVNFLKRANPSQHRPGNRAQYPRSAFGNSMLQIAQLIKSDVGLEIAFTDTGGWDTHVNQGNSRGQLANRLQDFADSISAFVTDLGDRMEDVLIVTMSEFGRTVRENGNRGTDHGHANAMFVIGGGVRGGKVYGDWPSLGTEHLYEGRDLALTTDFRTVLCEVARRHLGSTNLTKLFPGYNAIESRFRGVLG